MTHHLIRYNGAEGEVMRPGVWEAMAKIAAVLIINTRLIRDLTVSELVTQQAQREILKKGRELMQMSPNVTTDEKKTGQMSFDRGCRRITGLSKKEDAKRRFFFALPHINFLPKKPFDYYENNGFSLEEVLVFGKVIRDIPTKGLRKPYEKTGLFKPKSKKQKERKLEKAKKVLLGTSGEKRPKRGGISRA
jgi:hypothetical protein